MGFGKEIKRLREDAKISVQKIADKIGVDAERWRKWEERDLSPRMEDALRIEKFFGMDLEQVGKLPSIKKFLIVPRESGQSSVSEPEPELQFGPDGLTHNITLKILSDLAQSHKNLTAAHRELAESNNALAKNQETLLARMPSTDNDSTGIPIEISEAFAGILAVMAKLSTGKLHYKNEQEAALALGKFVPLPGRSKT